MRDTIILICDKDLDIMMPPDLLEWIELDIEVPPDDTDEIPARINKGEGRRYEVVRGGLIDQ